MHGIATDNHILNRFEYNRALLNQLSFAYMQKHEPRMYIINQCPYCFREKKTMMQEEIGKFTCQCGAVLLPTEIVRKWTA